MKVLTDFHHGTLYGAMKRLFEDRLGWELFRPIGKDWFTNKWWRIAEPYGNVDSTINQYLAINDKPYIPYINLNGGHEVINNIYHVYDPENDITHKAITLDTFKEMEFDLIIGSHPLHEMWEGLLQYQPKAKFIMQMGNENQQTDAKNVLSSVWAVKPKPGQNVCYYHQEFSLDGMGWSEPKYLNKINSFVHMLPHFEIYEIYNKMLPEFQFKAYGTQCPDGLPGSRDNMIDIMKESSFGWHIKTADGYGHLIHQWYACGRPIITKGDYYAGKTGGMLLTDGETCIDLDRHSLQENLDLIAHWSVPENNLKMCHAALDRFNAVCNFSTEADNIKTFLSNIL